MQPLIHGLVAPQIPQHLECPDNLTGPFEHMTREQRAFYNCCRLWCSQVGILTPEMKSDPKKRMHIAQFLNRMLGLNLHQQQIVFLCVAPPCACADPLDLNPRLENVQIDGTHHPPSPRK